MKRISTVEDMDNSSVLASPYAVYLSLVPTPKAPMVVLRRPSWLS